MDSLRWIACSIYVPAKRDSDLVRRDPHCKRSLIVMITKTSLTFALTCSHIEPGKYFDFFRSLPEVKVDLLIGSDPDRMPTHGELH